MDTDVGYVDASMVLGTITTVHLAMIAVFAVVVILGIIWGVRLRRRSKAGERELAERGPVVRQADTPVPTDAPIEGGTAHNEAPEESGRIVPGDVPPGAATRPERSPHTGFDTPAPTPAPAPARRDEPSVDLDRSPLQDEPIAAAAPLDASPASLAADLETPAPAPVPGHALTQIKGLGPKVAARLGELGVSSPAQLAALSDDDAAALDAQLGPFAGRMERDRWREQARLLAANDITGFEAAFGKL